MKFLLILLLFVPVITASDKHRSEKSHEEAKGGKEMTKDQALKEIVKGNTEFAMNVFKLLTSMASDLSENVVLSPFSISSALSMLMLGARAKTQQEIWVGLSLNNTSCKEMEVHKAYSSLLQVLNEPKSSLQVNIGNAIFVDQSLTLLTSFKDYVWRYYHADIMAEDFSGKKVDESKEKINGYVNNKTGGKITELIQDIPKDTKMILINYVLFKGKRERLQKIIYSNGSQEVLVFYNS